MRINFINLAFLRCLVLWIATTFLILTTSCSWYRLAIDHADFMMLWEADKYFDITSEQKKFLKPNIAKFLTWLRKEKARDIYKALEKAKSLISDHSKFNEKNVQEIRDLWSDFRVEAISFSANEIGQFFTMLSPEQWKHHKDILWKNNQEFAEPIDYNTEKLLTFRKEKIENSFSRFFGSPREDQMKLILDLGFYSSDSIREFLNERIESQKVYLELVSNQKNPLRISEGLKDWAKNPILLKPGNAGINYKRRIEVQNKALVKIIKSLDAKQVKVFQEKVDELKKIFST